MSATVSGQLPVPCVMRVLNICLAVPELLKYFCTLRDLAFGVGTGYQLDVKKIRGAWLIDKRRSTLRTLAIACPLSRVALLQHQISPLRRHPTCTASRGTLPSYVSASSKSLSIIDIFDS